MVWDTTAGFVLYSTVLPTSDGENKSFGDTRSHQHCALAKGTYEVIMFTFEIPTSIVH